MKALVLGGTGMLGSDLVAELRARGHEVEAPVREVLDLTRPESISRIAYAEIGKGAAWCFNCAAYTDVDRAEDEPELAYAVNAQGVGSLAEACARAGIRLLHIGTDYVFDGASVEPYTESSPVHPLGVYARSKLEGEGLALAASCNAVVARTAWLFGSKGNCFPKAIIRAWLSGKKPRVVSDQVGTPTYTADLARVLADLAERDAPGGVYHTAGPTIVTRYEYAVLALRAYRDEVLRDGRPIEVEACKSSDWPTKAPRPAFSALISKRLSPLDIPPMRGLEVALAEFCRRLGRLS